MSCERVVKCHGFFFSKSLSKNYKHTEVYIDIYIYILYLIQNSFCFLKNTFYDYFSPVLTPWFRLKSFLRFSLF